MKKCISLFMAIAMIFALAIPAFAQQATPGQSEVEVKGNISVPNIQIEAPSEATLVLNPYRMKYNGDIKSLKDSQDQILALPGVYVNKTDVDLKIEVTAVATTASTITQANAAPAANETAKKVYLTFQFGKMTDKQGGWDGTAPTARDFATAFPSGGTAGTIMLKKVSDSQDDRLKVDATDGKTANYFGFKFGGSATPDPNTAWDDKDTISVKVTVKATPIALTVASGS